MKSFKTILSEVAAPKSADEKAFRDKHLVQVMAHPVAADHQHTGDVGDGIVDPLTAKQRRLADYKKGEDMKVYENLDLAGKDVDKRLERERQQHIRKKIIDEKKMDPVGQEDGDIDNDGDVDKSDNYLHNRRKAIKKAMKESLENITEKAKSEAQQKAAAIALAVKRGEKPESSLLGASKEMYKMSEKDLEDYARTKHKGIPAKVSEEVELDEGIGGTYKNATEWENEAKSRGLTVKPATHPSGETTKYQIAKDKQGNNRGHFDHGTKSGKLIEEVELDEISTNLARSYIRKASADNKERKADVMKPFPLKGMEKNVADHKKFKKREAGIETAGKKVWEIGGKAKVPATESVELDEISKKTLGSYIRKAGNQRHDIGAELGKRRTQDTTSDNYQKQSALISKDAKRSAGIAAATRKLTKEEAELDEAKLERNTNTVGAHHLERDSGDHKLYTSYTGSLVRRLHTVTDKDDNILGQGMSAASAMGKAKLKKSHRDALMHDDNQIVKVHDTRGGHNVGTQVVTPGKGKWFKDHEEAMKFAKSLPGKIKHADEKGHVYSESVELDEETMPGNVALRLVDRHQAAALHHKKNGNMKGYAAHFKVANAIEDSVIKAGRDMPIRSKRHEAASDKAFKEHPHRVVKTEDVQLDEAFSAGMVKLKDGSSVNLKKQDADLLNKMFKDLNANNRKKMTDVAMTDKNGFEEILGFAREAL